MKLLNSIRSLLKFGGRTKPPTPTSAADDPTERKMWERWIIELDGSEPWKTTIVHKHLVKHSHVLLGNEGEKKKVFVPLCCKAVEMKWLYGLGHTVVGVDGSLKSVREFWKENDIENHSHETDNFQLFKTPDERLKIYCGDFYNFDTKIERDFDAVWDRGSLSVISLHLREKYMETILQDGLLTSGCNYLLEGFDFDTSVFAGGPPLLLSQKDVIKLFGPGFAVSTIDQYEFQMSKTAGKYFKTDKGEDVKVYNNLYHVKRM